MSLAGFHSSRGGAGGSSGGGGGDQPQQQQLWRRVGHSQSLGHGQSGGGAAALPLLEVRVEWDGWALEGAGGERGNWPITEYNH